MAEHVCPWWLGYFLASPVRRLWQKPEEIVAPFVRPGMTVLEVGPGMGFFTLSMARMVGEHGQIICPDIQEKMLKALSRRAKRAGVAERVISMVSSPDSLRVDDFAGRIDFVLAFAVVHEIPNQENLFREIHRAMKEGALLLVAEPKGHVKAEAFANMLTLAKSSGFEESSRPSIKRSYGVVLRKGK